MTCIFYESIIVTTILPAKDSFVFQITKKHNHYLDLDIKANAISKIFYDEPFPLEIPFTIDVEKWSKK